MWSLRRYFRKKSKKRYSVRSDERNGLRLMSWVFPVALALPEKVLDALAWFDE